MLTPDGAEHLGPPDPCGVSPVSTGEESPVKGGTENSTTHLLFQEGDGSGVWAQRTCCQCYPRSLVVRTWETSDQACGKACRGIVYPVPCAHTEDCTAEESLHKPRAGALCSVHHLPQVTGAYEAGPPRSDRGSRDEAGWAPRSGCFSPGLIWALPGLLSRTPEQSSLN